MKQFSIRRGIIGCFAVVLAMVTLVGTVSYGRFVGVDHQTRLIQQDAVPGLSTSLQLQSAWESRIALLEAQILANDPAAINVDDAAIGVQRNSVDGLIAQYKRLINQDQEQQIFDRLSDLNNQYSFAESSIEKYGDANQDGPARDATETQLRPLFTEIQANLQKLVVLNETNVDTASANIIASIALAKTIILVSFIVALLVAVACGYLLYRMATELAGLIGQVQKTGVQVSTSITEIAATSKQQQATACEIAATTTEIGATSKEISATSNELVRTMADVSSVAEHTAALAGGGQAGLGRMEDTMRHVAAAAAVINSELGTLNQKAGNINQVVTTITKVADQTNLLSLNAAIEAEKAGEYGRGFAVVATEVRRLADQTAISTYDIELMVKDIQSAVAASVMGMDKFSEEVRRGMTEMQQVGSQLSEIIVQVQGLAPRIESVNEGMQAQATGAEQISQALTQLSEAAQQTVESLRQTSTAMEELNHASNGLHGSIHRFRLHA